MKENPNKAVKYVLWIGLAAVIILIIGVGLAVREGRKRFISFAENARAESIRMACVSSLRMIQGAKEVWMLEGKRASSEVPSDADLFGGSNPLITKRPVCSGGGTYIIGALGEKPRCSVPGHTF